MPKIVCISDTHMTYPEVPDGDILIHSGDYSFVGTENDTNQFNAWLSTLPHKIKLVVPGNHDWLAFRDAKRFREIMTAATVLIDEEVFIDGLKFYGTPWVPKFCKWAFMANETKLAQIFANIPDDTDVLISHGPPYGILDEVTFYTPQTCEFGVKHCGSKALRDRVLKVKPKLNCFGHIHPDRGELHMSGIHFVNAAMVNDRCELVNQAIVVSL